MKLIKLEIYNLASLDKKGGEEINFEAGALRDSNIFCIVGPTGSGKSTLLDAICLALYGRAPRYPRKKGEKKQFYEILGESEADKNNRLAPTDPRNILTRGEKRGHSKLTFIANDGCLYRAEWHVEFALKNYKEARTVLYKFSVVNGESRVEELPWDRLPQIIGLDYDQFLRTVLIAQGSFANFLNAREEDRYELLEKLVGNSDIYSRIAKEIKLRKDDADAAFNIVNAALEADKQFILTDDILAELDGRIRALEQMEREAAARLQQLKTDLLWHDEEAKKAADIRTKETGLQNANARMEQIRADAERLKLNDALAPAIELLREITMAEREIVALNSRISACQEEIAKNETRKSSLQTALAQLQNEADNARNALEKTAPHILAARELKTKIDEKTAAVNERLLARQQAEQDFHAAEQAAAQNAQDILSAQQAVARAEEAYKKTMALVEQKKQELRQSADEAQKYLEARKEAIRGMDAFRLQAEKTAADRALQSLTKAISVLSSLQKSAEDEAACQKRLDTLCSRNQTIDFDLSRLTIDSLTEEVETLQSIYTLMTSKDWEQQRIHLKPDTPCPLCGAVHHPFCEDKSLYVATETKASALLLQKRSQLEQQKKTQQELLQEKNSNRGEITFLQSRISQLRGEIEEYERLWTDVHAGNPEFHKQMHELQALQPALAEQLRKADEALNRYNSLLQEINELSEKKTEADKKAAAYANKADIILREASESNLAANTLLTRVEALKGPLATQLRERHLSTDKAYKEWDKANAELLSLRSRYAAELGGESPDDVEIRLKKSIEKADKAIQTKQEEIQHIVNSISSKRGEKDTLTTQLKSKSETSATKHQRLQLWLTAYNADLQRIREVDIDIVRQFMTADDDWEAIRSRQQQFNDAVVSASALLVEAKANYATHLATRPQKSKETLTEEIAALQQDEHKEELVSARAKRKNHDDAICRLGDKAEELERFKTAKTQWSAIYDAVGGGEGKTLRKIAQCYTLSFLIEHANDEIRKFNNRYELQQIKNSLGIRVIDHDRADDIRDTTSLSGGETFIVSLGLALGLSALSSRNISFDNLFIDEGFGTLDADALAVVIDSLAMLQSNQGKKVGVISHTDIMSERITTQIRIVKNGSSGSSHIEIYPSGEAASSKV
ncbi:MAG: hypothetical protein K6F94_07485 [Bacteroidaceae bacterium]|nr:hypothetical protein [Bacteroidaceae bacterium]